MSFFNSLITGLFTQQNKAESILKEKIERTTVFLLDYQQWVNDSMQKGILSYLDELRAIRSSNPFANVNFYTHQSKLSNGFYFYLEDPWSGKDYDFFVQYIIERLKLMGYVISNSLREAKEANGELIVLEEYYLKPGLRFRKEMPYEQLFGNIHLELKVKNDQVQMVKVLVNSYSDRNFKDAKSYESFLEYILSE